MACCFVPTWILLAVALLAVGSPVAIAADKPDAEAVRRQTAEVERLQEELRRAQEELKRLRQEDDPAVRESPELPAPALTAKPGGEPESGEPAVGLEEASDAWPKLQKDTVVIAAELAGHFRARPEAAAEHYVNKVFRVSGTVVGFSQSMFIRRYELELDSPDKALDVVGRFNYVDVYKSLYTADRGRTLLGRLPGGSARVVCKQGDPVVFEGRCKGLKNRAILFVDCERVQ